jgi:Rha family phage regulatory protein
MLIKRRHAQLGAAMNDMVILNGNTLVTDSRIVAAHFGKLHKNVLRDIHAMRDSDEPEIREHHRLNFEQTVETRVNPSGGAPIPSIAYRMTKDGLSELAMSFTGNKARLVRIRFIAAFNAMAEHIDRRDSNVWNEIHELEKRDAASFELASLGSRQMLKRKAELPELVTKLVRLNSLIQMPLFPDEDSQQ